MQIQSRVADTLNQKSSSVETFRPAKNRSGDARLDADTIGASVVIALTAVFIVILFGLVTDYIPSLAAVLLIGLFTGTSSGLIALTLMKH
ncbi:MAG: hypothetical protein EBZ36_14620 [Acidobacteria bacterium]|jgi:preprotein translocase subunit SecF|nr:hypothetical protein [Acidobacteriota bacterium]